jgi:UbiD family decarboxylase
MIKYSDLRDFISQLQRIDELKQVDIEVSPHLEMTEVCDRTLRAEGLRFYSTNQPAIASLCWQIYSARRVALRLVWARMMSVSCARSAMCYRLSKNRNRQKVSKI